VSEGVIRKADLKKLAAAVAKAGRFFGPVRGEEGVVLAEVGADTEMAFDYVNVKLPLKRHFFPRTEVLYRYEKGELRDVPLPDGKTVVFGARACDAGALQYLDKVFLGEPAEDPYYARRRANAVVIVLACGDPASTCFCTSLGGGPANRQGADVLAVDLGDSLLFESVSKGGEAFLKEHAKLLAKPKAEESKAAAKAVAEAEKKMRAVGADGATERMKAAADSDMWEHIVERCLGCGICTQVCPTCHCFGIYDERKGSGGRRMRVQDACMFPGFTLEASGHNPRGQRGQRMRQRVMHKFCFAAEKYGDVFCVGCGRCISECPVNMDIRETITATPQDAPGR
jgi:ferredoxin